MVNAFTGDSPTFKQVYLFYRKLLQAKKVRAPPDDCFYDF